MPEHYLSTGDPLAKAAVEAIRSGDIETLKRLLAENLELATARLGGAATINPCEMSRTLLHVVTDWPGHCPNGPRTVAALTAAGADVNARFAGPHSETPLHWAASCDDVAVLDALLDHGADIEAPGAVIGNGTPLADACAFGQWNCARRLVERQAREPHCGKRPLLGCSHACSSTLPASRYPLGIRAAPARRSPTTSRTPSGVPVMADSSRRPSICMLWGSKSIGSVTTS